MEKVIERIYKSALKFLVPLSAEETYKLIIKECMSLTAVDYASLLLKKDKKLIRVYSSHPEFYQIKNRPKGSMYQVFNASKMEALNTPRLTRIHPMLKKLNVQSIIAVPLSYKNVSIGVMSLQSKKQYFFKSKVLAILHLFAPLVTLAIRKMQLYEEVQKALQMRDLFISMAAHELRTPLTSVNGYTQLLRSKLSGSDSIESKWVEQLYWETTRLTKLVNELLEINRIRGGKFHYVLKECSLREIINRVYSDLRFLYPSREIEVEDKLEGRSDMVIGDYDKIIQVLTNLMDNAVKFSPPHTKINLSLKDKGADLIVAVEDQGIGISKQDKSRVFEGFQQGRGHNEEGMGLGLYLVKDIVSKLHGKLKIHSKVNKGTIIEVFLPKFI